MRKLVLFAILIVATASMAFAQSTDDYHKVEGYVGYSHNRVDTGLDDGDTELSDIVNEREGFNGVNASITGNLSRYIGIKGDFAVHVKNKTFPVLGASVDVDSSVYNFLGGVQIKDNSKETRFKPFAHALIGAARVRNKVEFSSNFCAAIAPSPCPTNSTETETGFAGAFGAGLDIRAGRRVDVRVIQFDYNPTHVFDQTQHNFRIGAGIVFH
jgi:opacity protein-like surface antigen